MYKVRPEVRLKKDVQQAIANNIDLSSSYSGFDFAGERKHFIISLLLFKNLKITASNLSLNLDGELNRDLVKLLDEETIQNVNRAAWRTQQEDLIIQFKEKKLSPEQKIEEMVMATEEWQNEFEDFLQKEQTKQYRKCTSKDINILKDIKKKLNVESAIIKTDTDVYINILENEINFKEGDIYVLFSLLENNTLDFITIVPRLNKETLLQINDILKGEHRKQQVQMVLGISLEDK